MPYTDSKIKTGELRHRIDIVQPGPVQDSAGGVSLINASPLVTVWAKIEAITGKDALAADQFNSVVTHEVTIRYRAGVVAQQQIWFNDRTFEIMAVLNPDQRTKTLILLCVEINDSVQQPTLQPGGLK